MSCGGLRGHLALGTMGAGGGKLPPDPPQHPIDHCGALAGTCRRAQAGCSGLARSSWEPFICSLAALSTRCTCHHLDLVPPEHVLYQTVQLRISSRLFYQVAGLVHLPPVALLPWFVCAWTQKNIFSRLKNYLPEGRNEKIARVGKRSKHDHSACKLLCGFKGPAAKVMQITFHKPHQLWESKLAQLRGREPRHVFAQGAAFLQILRTMNWL